MSARDKTIALPSLSSPSPPSCRVVLDDFLARGSGTEELPQPGGTCLAENDGWTLQHWVRPYPRAERDLGSTLRSDEDVHRPPSDTLVEDPRCTFSGRVQKGRATREISS